MVQIQIFEIDWRSAHKNCVPPLSSNCKIDENIEIINSQNNEAFITHENPYLDENAFLYKYLDDSHVKLICERYMKEFI